MGEPRSRAAGGRVSPPRVRAGRPFVTLPRMKRTRAVLRAPARLYQRVTAPFILTVGYAGMALFLLYFLLNSGFAWRAFDDTVNPLFDGEIRWRRLTIDPLTLELGVLGAALIDGERKVVITADEVRVDVSLADLARGRIWADAVTIDDAVVRLTGRDLPDEYGLPELSMNIARMFESPDPGPRTGEVGEGLHLYFRGVDINNVQFSLDLPSVLVLGADLEVDEAYFELTPEGEMFMGAAGGRASAAEVRIPLRDDDRPPGTYGFDPATPEPMASEVPLAESLQYTASEIVFSRYSWSGERFSVGALDGRVRGGTVSVRGFEMDLEPPLPTMALQAEVEVADVAPHVRQYGLDFLSGPAAATTRLRGPADLLSGTVDAEGPSLQVGPLGVGPWTLAARLDEEAVAWDRLEAEVLGGRLRAAGLYDGLRSRLRTTAEVEGVDPGALPFDLPRDARRLIAGQLRADVDLRLRDIGSERPTVTAHATGRLRRREVAAIPLDALVRFDGAARQIGDRVDVHRLVVRAGVDRAEVAGRLDTAARTMDLDASVALGEVQPVMAAFEVPLSGRVEARGRVGGTFDAPRIEAQAVGTGVRYADWPGGDVSGGAVWSPSGVELRRVEASTDAGDVAANGTIELGGRRSPGPRLDLDVEARSVRIGALPLPWDVDGVATGTAKLSGPIARLGVDGRVTVEGPRWRTLEMDAVEVDAAWNGAAAEVRSLSVRRDGRSLLDASGRVDVEGGAYDGRVDLDRAPFTLLNHIVEAPPPIRGLVSAQLQGAGTFEDPRGRGRITLEGAEYDIYTLGDGRLDVRAEGQSVNLQGQVFGGLTVDAALPATRNGPPAAVRVEFTGLRLEERLPQMADLPLETALSGRVAARMDLFDLDPATMEIEAVLNETLAVWEGTELRNDGDVRLAWRHEVLTVESFEFGVGGQPLSITGTVGGRGDLDLRMAGDQVDLAVVQPFVSPVFTSFTGLAPELEVLVTGWYDDPLIEGRLQLDSLYATPRETTVGREIELRQPVTLRFERPIGPQMDTGVFVVNLEPADPRQDAAVLDLRRDEGRVVLDEVLVLFRRLRPSLIRVGGSLEDIDVRIPDTLRGSFSIRDFSFAIDALDRPRLTRMELEGDVQVLELEYTADVLGSEELSQGIGERFSGVARTRSVGLFERVPLLKRLWVDLTVRGESDNYVRNEITIFALDLEIQPRLSRVRGFIYPRAMPENPDDRLQIEGTVTVSDDSTVEYAGRKFQVVEGEVQFGPDPFMTATVRAQRDFEIPLDDGDPLGGTGSFSDTGSDYRLEEVTLTFGFRMQTRDSELEWRPRPRFESSSGASDIDVATLVLTGRYPSQLSGAAGAQPALELLLAQVLANLERPIEETLELELNISAQSTGALEVDVNKQIFRRLRLTSRAEVGGEEVGNRLTLSAEYRLNNTLYGVLTNEQANQIQSTTGLLRLRLSLD